MKLLAHPDPFVLEGELLARVDAAHPARAVGRTLVVVPSAGLARHVQRRLAGIRRGWLGLEVLHLRELAHRVLERADEPAPRVLSDRLLDALLLRVLRARRDNAWSRFVASRPGAVGRLRGALSDLREAWIEPAAVAAGAGSDTESSLAEIYGGYCEALGELAGRGWGDDATLARAALDHAGEFVRGCGAVLLHGAYELIGIHLDLVRAFDRVCGVTALVAMRGGSPATGYAEAFAREFLGAEPAEPVPDRAGLRRPDLAALYDESSRPAPAPQGHFEFRHAQGEAAEVKVALRWALEAVRVGCPPEEIVLAARTLEPYAPALEEAFEEAGVPWASSLGGPLRRHPAVRDFLLLLEVADEDFPRDATARLLRSPRIRWRSIARDLPQLYGDRADRWSRRARILGGIEEWTSDLPRWAGEVQRHDEDASDPERTAIREEAARERGAEAGAIAGALTALRNEVAPAPRPWSDHAERLGDLLRSLFYEPDTEEGGAALELARGILREMGDLAVVAGEPGNVPFTRMRSWLDEAIDSSAVPLQRKDEGGLRVLDLMQLRGLTCRRLYLLGANSGVLPRSRRDDPILTDRLRRALRERTRRPLPLKEGAAAEERLLLALSLGAATERVAVSWQRADESGRAKTPSLALREVARLASGRPDAEALGPEHVPSHPTQALEHLLERPALLSPGEQVLLAALHSRGPAALGRLGQRFPELAPGLAMLGATQSFAIVDPSFDGRIGPPARSDSLSVTALERLGRCPLQHFFRDVLHVKELDEAARAIAVEPRELGSLVHDLLQRIYSSLIREGAFDAPLPQLQRRARELLEGERTGLLGDYGRRLARRLPVLAARLERSWLDAVGSFLDADLAWLAERESRPDALEQGRAAALDLGQGRSIAVHGRFDRVSARDGRALVSDYKTSGKLAERCNVTQMLKGSRVQVPLYALLAGPEADVELLGIGPDFDARDEAGYRFRFAGFTDATREGFRETMRVLADLRAQGAFPLKHGTHCAWCAYEQACRHVHPPTEEREKQAPDAARYHRLAGKQAQKPLLADLERPR